MGTINRAAASAVAIRNIKIGLVDSGITQNALALRAGISSTTFDRKFKARPEKFTIDELEMIAAALDLKFEDLFKEAA